MTDGLLAGLRLRSVYAFNRAIHLREQYGFSRLFDTVTYYPGKESDSEWISSTGRIDMIQISKNTCGESPITCTDVQKRMIDKIRYFTNPKISICDIATTSQNWVNATMMALMDAGELKMDETIIQATSAPVTVQKDASSGTKTLTYVQDGVKVVDATSGDGLTKVLFDQLITMMQEQNSPIGGPGNPTTLVITPTAFAQLKNSYGNALPAYNYREEYIGRGSRVINGIDIVILPTNMFPKDGANFLGAIYNKQAIGFTTVPLEREEYDLAPKYKSEATIVSPLLRGYRPMDVIGMPSVTQQASRLNDYYIQFQFLVGATRLDPSQMVLVKLKS